MRYIVLVASLCFSFLAYAGSSQGVSYTYGIQDKAWTSHSSVFECRMEHAVPYFGRAVFRTRAGEASGFYFKGLTARFKAGEAKVVSKSPVWKPHNEVENLGFVNVKQGKSPMWLGSKTTEKYLSELNKGKALEFVRKAWYEPQSNASMRLEIGNIGFREQYRKYLNCLAGLLPANFDQLKRTALYFSVSLPEDSDNLESSVTRKLDLVLTLVKHDKSIRHFYIDGHTSSPGTREDNFALSQRRAELVAEYLTRRGIPKDQVVVRWHGERYPVTTNATRSGRAKNRRVTLRLDREEDIDMAKKSMAAK